ncbi:hypothetical protein SISSUDRAFT_1056460 [Sistotremastrum suecicum HHB10207 ss-3]|uniref:MYND-type domain-containing protein n=1 Tax=Sistotremastrum suecicum HHB10207 ss-3 TaxID=1314776 RepID=A0A165WTW7_9AGAM|nr:hypothetical protein SISSUDRAFT_1056460 [Sistotremastrum suecicum HHB10207 ss-3]
MDDKQSSQTGTLSSPDETNDMQGIILDLHDISLLLNYERGATEPRFRHAKLREVATAADFKTFKTLNRSWTDARAPRTGLIFEKPSSDLSAEKMKEPDLPSNMLPQPIPSDLQTLTAKQLETLYWQARNHDGCFRSVTLFKHFIDLFPSSTRLRIRTMRDKIPCEYFSVASERIIMEFHLIEQSSLMLAAVFPDNKTYISGADTRIIHAVLGFAPEGGDFVETILDLASLQFGDVGRGFNGRGIFVLEDVDEYESRLDRFAQANTFEDAKRSKRITDAPDSEWLRQVALKVKARWDNRQSVAWCAHCGAPPARGQGLKRCTQCKQAHYCDAEHQFAAWPFHKHFCKANPTAT